MVAQVTTFDFLRAVAIAGTTGKITAPLRAAAGTDEHQKLDPSKGGFLVPDVLANEWFLTARAGGKLLSRVRWNTDTTVGGEFHLPTTDESARTDGERHGGARVVWKSETAAATTSTARVKLERYPKLTMIGLAYVSMEALSSPLTAGFITDVFGDEFRFQLEDKIMWGSTGTLGGMLTSGALITVWRRMGAKRRIQSPRPTRKIWLLDCRRRVATRRPGS